MALIIFPRGTSGGSDTSGLTNLSTLRKLSTDSNGNLCFDGNIISNSSVEVPYNITLTKAIIGQKFIELPNDCDTSRIITLSIQGIQMQQGTDWEVITKVWPQKDLIAWEGLGLETLAQVGDKILISYYRK